MLMFRNRNLFPGEFPAALSMTLGICSVMGGWCIPLPIVGIAFAIVALKRTPRLIEGSIAPPLARVGFVLSLGGMIGWLTGLWLAWR